MVFIKITAASQIGLGIRTHFTALNYLFSKKIIWYLLFPIIINILLYFGGHALLSGLKQSGLNWFQQIVNFDASDSSFIKFLKPFLTGLLSILFEIIYFFAFAYIGGYIVMAVMSPILAKVSEKTEQMYNGLEYSADFKQTVKDVIRGIALSIKNLLIQTIITLVLFVISFIPVIGWFCGIIIFFLNTYYFGFGFMDYTCERHKMNVKQSIRYAKQYKWLAITIGCIFSLSLFIPFCGLAISVFVAILSVIATTLAMCEISDKQKKADEQK